MNRDKRSLGVALAGGGPQGAIYEIGTLRALEEAIEGLDFTQVDSLVGVSAGAVVAACLANRISSAQMVRSIVRSEPGEHPFEPELFLSPAFREYVRSAGNLPHFAWEAIKNYFNDPDSTVVKSLTKLSGALPTGLFDNRPIRTFLEKMFAIKGRTNDFRELSTRLYVVAADLDRGTAVKFGMPGRDHIPISLAVQASTAMPGIYPPVEIEGRDYLDGVLLKTLHTSTILDEGADLAICINPIVPVDTHSSVEAGYLRRGRLVDRGMPGVLSQTLRTLIHSRMNIGFASYSGRYNADLLLFEPGRDDFRMFFTNVFSFSGRRAVCEHAYNRTMENLSKRRDEIAPILARHGLRLKVELLDGGPRSLWESVGLSNQTGSAIQRLNEAISRLESVVAQKS